EPRTRAEHCSVTVDTVRVRSVDDVVIAFFEPNIELTAASTRPWFAAAEAPGIGKSLVLTVGPLIVDPDLRRTLVATLSRLGVRVVAVTDNRLNRGLIGMLGW